MKQQSAGRHVESGVKHLLPINGLLRSTDPAQLNSWHPMKY